MNYIHNFVPKVSRFMSKEIWVNISLNVIGWLIAFLIGRWQIKSTFPKENKPNAIGKIRFRKLISIIAIVFFLVGVIYNIISLNHFLKSLALTTSLVLLIAIAASSIIFYIISIFLISVLGLIHMQLEIHRKHDGVLDQVVNMQDDITKKSMEGFQRFSQFIENDISFKKDILQFIKNFKKFKKQTEKNINKLKRD